MNKEIFEAKLNQEIKSRKDAKPFVNGQELTLKHAYWHGRNGIGAKVVVISCWRWNRRNSAPASPWKVKVLMRDISRPVDLDATWFEEYNPKPIEGAQGVGGAL